MRLADGAAYLLCIVTYERYLEFPTRLARGNIRRKKLQCKKFLKMRKASQTGGRFSARYQQSVII
jgi:hypothetical protein